MRKLAKLSLLMLTCNYSLASAHAIDSTLTLGEFYSLLGKVYAAEACSNLSYKTYPDFDFAKFVPVEGHADSLNFVVVGFDADNHVRELVFRRTGVVQVEYRLCVHEFEQCRLLTLELGTGRARHYLPVVFVRQNGGQRNFMVNLLPQFGPETHWNQDVAYSDLPEADFEEISAIMLLDENLNPTDLIRLKDGSVFLITWFKYGKDQSLLYELGHFFANGDKHDELKLDPAKSPWDFLRHTRYADLVTALQPALPEGSVGLVPIWIFAWRHEYK